MKHIFQILKETYPTCWRVGVGWMMFALNRQSARQCEGVCVWITGVSVNLHLSLSSCWTCSRSGIGRPTWLTTGKRPANTWESTHTPHWPCWRSTSLISPAASAGFPLFHHTVICLCPSFPSVNSLESTVLPTEHWSSAHLIVNLTNSLLEIHNYLHRKQLFLNISADVLSPVRPLCHVLTGYLSREYRLICVCAWVMVDYSMSTDDLLKCVNTCCEGVCVCYHVRDKRTHFLLTVQINSCRNDADVYHRGGWKTPTCVPSVHQCRHTHKHNILIWDTHTHTHTHTQPCDPAQEGPGGPVCAQEEAPCRGLSAPLGPWTSWRSVNSPVFCDRTHTETDCFMWHTHTER